VLISSKEALSYTLHEGAKGLPRALQGIRISKQRQKNVEVVTVPLGSLRIGYHRPQPRNFVFWGFWVGVSKPVTQPLSNRNVSFEAHLIGFFQALDWEKRAHIGTCKSVMWVRFSAKKAFFLHTFA
jgi:hypothetical protein